MISFTIPGTPVPQGRPRVTRTGHAYYDEKTKEYRERVKQCAIASQNGCDSLTGALAMIVDCTFPVPDSWPKYKRQEALKGKWHIVRPDASNILKGIEDSLNGIVYDDDSQIVVSMCFKHYGAEPETRVTVFELKEDCSPCWLIAHLKKEVRFYEK